MQVSDEKKPVPPALKARLWPKGVSGNPAGRAKGLERLVRETVGDDIVAVIKAQVSIAKGLKPEGLTTLPEIKASDITKAAEWLADRGWGKARQTVDIGPEVNVADADLTKLDRSDLDDLIARLEHQVAADEESDAPASDAGTTPA